jgi:hypothetical protein
MKQIYFLILTLTVAFSIYSCEKEYIPEDVFDNPELVVEGYIEYGDSALPPYVILTKSFPYTSTLSADKLNELFVHNATVKVSDGNTEIQLTEICLNTIAAIDTALAQMVAQSIGLGDVDITQLNYCVYVDLAAFLGSSPLIPTVGKTYDLLIIAEGDTIRSQTTIPPLVELDSVFYVNHPDFPQNDSLVELRGTLSDFAGRQDYYRVFTKRNNEPRYALIGGSVIDDSVFEGRQSFEFPIQRGQSITQEFDPNTFGYFWRGDTAVVRFSNIDYRHFRFWETLEFNLGTQGPFSTYVRVESNIQGGLGVWGGISFKDYKIIIL